MMESRTIEQITLEKLKIYVQQYLNMGSGPMGDMRIDIYNDEMLKSLVLTIKTYILSNKVNETIVDTYAVPKTWWDAWKLKNARRLPDFIQTRLNPIKFEYKDKTINHYHVCPHGDMKWDHTHISFMITDDVKTRHQKEILEKRRKHIHKQLGEYPPAHNSEQLIEEVRAIDDELKLLEKY